MAKYWNSSDKDEAYILERTGYPEKQKGKTPLRTFIKYKIDGICKRVFCWSKKYQAYKVGKFMLSGETHKWMYDEYGMELMLKKIGFQNIRRMKANESNLSNWQSYGLEMNGDCEYKPHSLYIEACKNV